MSRKHMVLIFLVGTLVFSNSLRNGFVGDDGFLIVFNDFFKSWENFPKLFHREYITDITTITPHKDHFFHSGSWSYRPVFSAILFLNYHFWKLDPFGYHLFNLLIHLLNAVLVYGIIFFILRDPWISLFSGLLFAIHPVQAEAVNSINSCPTSCSALFALISFYCFLRYPFYHGIRRRVLAGGMGLSYLLAVFTKESAGILPLIMILYDFCYDSGIFQRGIRVLFYRYGQIIFITFFYLFIYLKVFPSSAWGMPHRISGSLIEQTVTMGTILLWYVHDLIFPFWVNVLPPQFIPSLGRSIVGKVLFGFAAGVGIWLFAKKEKKYQRDIIFFTAWFLAAYIPVANIIALIDPMAHRYLYFPAVGLLTVMAIFFRQLAGRFSQAVPSVLWNHVFCGCLVVVCAYVTIQINGFWRSNESMGRELVKKYPLHQRSCYILAAEYFNSGRCQEAVEGLNRCQRIGLNDPSVHFMLGMCSLNNYEFSRWHFFEAIRQSPRYAVSYAGLGVLYYNYGHYQQAYPYLRESIELDPNRLAYEYLIRTELALGRKEVVPHILENVRQLFGSQEADRLAWIISNERP